MNHKMIIPRIRQSFRRKWGFPGDGARTSYVLMVVT
jgi:hypothetical protein